MYRTKTERGELESTVVSGKCSTGIVHSLLDVNWDPEDGDVREVVEDVLELEFASPEARVYQSSLKESYVLYGRSGVRVQLLYIAGNLDVDSELEVFARACGDLVSLDGEGAGGV